MKDQILAKIKKIIMDNSMENLENDQLEFTSADLDHAIEEIETLMDFWEDRIVENTLEQVGSEISNTQKYVQNIIQNIKDKNTKLERSEDEN